MCHPRVCRELLPITVNAAVVIAWPISVVVADARAYDRAGISWRIIVIPRRVIRGWVVIPAIIGCHVGRLRTPA